MHVRLTRACRSNIKNSAVRIIFRILTVSHRSSTCITDESERYRDLLRRRDEEIKVIKEQTDMTVLEAQKLASVAATYEAQIEALHQELESAQQAVSALDEQKQENMFLKETIDRMRYDMDEMRTSSGGGPGSGAASIRGSVSKSLGAELLGKMKWQSEEDVEYVTSDPEDRLSDEEEEEIEEIVGGDETESEDVIQTIITRTKRVGVFGHVFFF